MPKMDRMRTRRELGHLNVRGNVKALQPVT